MARNEFIPVPKDPPPPPLPRGEPDKRGVQRDIAKADKVARTGSTDEPVRDTPPSGRWNDTSHD